MKNDNAQFTPNKNQRSPENGLTQEKEPDIAIIGMACRFPGAKNYEEFWANLVQGRMYIQEIPQVRWDWKSHFGEPQTENNKTNSKWGGFIEDVDAFDINFFGFPASEVETMDPQQRIMLELAWSCFEDAGIPPSQVLGDKVGVFIGVANLDYKELQENGYHPIETFYASGIAASVITSRISYCFNFKGPSFSLDTACSSSLNAIHSAIQSIRRGECSMALAGGVSLLLTPPRYISFAKMGLLSPTGSCKTFDEDADGIVRGEGAGLILLKPLNKALEDGDLIYGILKGSAINHSGKTRTLTYPNPDAQAEVIITAMKQAGVLPESISYIEAHGTGTPKGDPLEFQGLVKAFRDLEIQDQSRFQSNYCGLGAVKTNIGHLESAAGIAGVIKVLLSMKYKQLPALSNFKKLNHRISLKDTPFYIVDHLQQWEPLSDMNGQTLPRRAGVSAFGFAGTNAHVIIEEAPGVAPPAHRKLPAYLICLSAKTEEALRQKEQDLALWLNNQAQENNLYHISATLLLGREHFKVRAAYVVRDVEELRIKIRQVCESGDVEGYFKESNLGKWKQAQSFYDELSKIALKELSSKKLNERDYGQKLMVLAELFVNRYDPDWKMIFPDVTGYRIHLPTYPFARERYWVPATVSKTVNSQMLPKSTFFIHPLLHHNTSNLSEQRFTTTFTGTEFFIAARSVQSSRGSRILPAAALLEMARAAIESATDTTIDGISQGNRLGIQLKEVKWVQPVIIPEQPLRIHIGVFPEADGGIAYEIYRECEEDESGFLIYCQGKAVFHPVGKAPTLNLPDLQTRCQQTVLTSSQFYDIFRMKGFQYGPGQQGIEEVDMGPDQVLVKLALPASIQDTLGQYILHPGLVDSALHASLGFLMNPGDRSMSVGETGDCLMPFALQELEIFGGCTSRMWASIRRSESNQLGDIAGRRIPVLDIDICDDQGTVRIRMKGMEFQENPEEIQQSLLEIEPQETPSLEIKETFEMMTFEEVWQAETLGDANPGKPKTVVIFLSHPENQQVLTETLQTPDQLTHFIFIVQSTTYEVQASQNYTICRSDPNTYEKALRSIRETYGEIDAVLYLWAFEEPALIRDYSCIVFLLQAMTSAKLRTNRFILAAQFKNDLDRCYLESWIGFERSLRMNLPDTQIAVICQEAGEPESETARKDWFLILERELGVRKAECVMYQAGVRYVCRLRPSTVQPGNGILKPGGTYLITGGCGGLGNLFAKHFAKSKPLNLILTGRSPMDAEKQSQIKALEDLGSRAIYLQADVCNITGMKKALKLAKEQFGPIHGVIHAAGLQGTQSIFTKEIQSFEKVIDPKIKGTRTLDEVLKAEPLDFICYFSSAAAVLGDFGSCDYTIANRFMMAYAHFRNQQQLRGERQGKAVVINWPLWKDGGMGFDDEENTQMYLKSSGQRYLETEEGLAVFDDILSQPKGRDQYSVFVGQPSRVHRFLGLTEEQPAKADIRIFSTSFQGRRPEMKGLSLEQCLEWDLKQFIHKLVRIPREKIDRTKSLAEFGFNSIILTQFAILLMKHFRIELTPALFFKYSSVEKLIRYLLTEHSAAIQTVYQEEVRDGAVTIKPDKPPAAVTDRIMKRQTGRSRFAIKGATSTEPEPIAIIGMSGRFPGARNIDELWRILVAGQDVVGEIPKERLNRLWNYGDSRQNGAGEPGKISYKWCGCIPGVSEFEPLFFEISPKEAETMDPRQRLLLQESWNALEDAGFGPEQVNSQKIGMFVGVEQGDYQFLAGEAGSITSNNNAILAARLAYFLNLNGPVMAIDTACSSGLVAAHQAVLSLRNGECDTALAAAVNLMLSPKLFTILGQAGMLSEDGKCFAFDQRANGMVPGEAVAVVVLKRLSQAETDGDPIYAVIKGSGINYDGKTNGITAPNGVSQSNLLKSIYQQYRVNPEEIEYIVTHGTGTKLGDPVEINALYDAFKAFTKKQVYCALTSTKTNFGHTFSASGLVSLISLVQALRHETIPASLHCEQENDYINWNESPFFINKSNRTWPGVVFSEDAAISAGRVRTGAVSAFGMSGTNAHMVVQSYSGEANMARGRTGRKAPHYLLALSAKTGEALEEKVKDLIAMLQNMNTVDLSRVSYTLLEGRHHFNHRCAIVIQDWEDAVYVLKQTSSPEKLPNLFRGKVPRDFAGPKAIELYAQDLLKQAGTFQDNPKKYQEILFALAELYCQGYEIPWKQLFGGIQPHRLHLPAYPFARESYWKREPDLKFGREAAACADVRMPIIENEAKTSGLTKSRRMSFLKKQWEPCPAASVMETNRRILIWATQETNDLAAQLGKHFPDSTVLNANNDPELTGAFDSWENYGGWVDLSGCGPENNSFINESWQWLPKLQQLIEHNLKKDLMILCVTQGLESFQNTTVNLSGASRAGLYRMLQSEYGYLRSRHMDAEPGTSYEELARQIASEFRLDSDDAEICYREGKRYRSYLEELPDDNDDTRTMAFPGDQVLWITGGTRGLGFLCAQHFVANYGVKRLVLTGREVFPPREEWDSYVRVSSPIAPKIQAIQHLEEQGVEIKVLSVSLSDPVMLRHSQKEISKSMGRIGGIIHCAGIAGDDNPAFIRKSADKMKEVFEPKVNGLKILYQCLKNEPLRFLVAFSSVAAIIPALASGQSDYAMANAFMDYFAEKVSRETGPDGCPVISIQWPNWKETGMGEVKSEAYRQTGLLSHTNAEGLELLDYTLFRKPGPVIMPAYVNPELWKPYQLMKRTLRVALPANTGYSIPADQSQIMEEHNESLLNGTIKWLITLFSKELKIDPEKLEINTQFQEFGIDSIFLAQVIRRMDQELGQVAIEPSSFLEHPTIKSFAGHLIQTYPAALSSLVSSEDESVAKITPGQEPVQLPPTPTSSLGEEKWAGFFSHKTGHNDKIAVIGMACHFPEAPDIRQYWENLKTGRDSIHEIPKSRWDWEKNYDPIEAGEGKIISKWGAFLTGIEEFDPQFFKISESLAPQIDPLQRQWLEVSAEALADAGYEKNDLWGKEVGVFVGARTGNFAQKISRKKGDTIIGTGQNFIAVHLAHIYNFKGPNMVVDTACASSLTAIHLAVKSIQNGESELALAGGVDILDESPFLVLSASKILSPEGRCKAFDAGANGIGLGEGCGVLVLKPLSKAIRDHDKIYGVIDGSSLNNDGNTMGVTTPNPQAQQDLIEKAIANAGINVETISYIEAHGTGTLIGDPIELKGLTKIFSARTGKKQFCGIGSVKSNIGHLLNAAGVAGIIKVFLAMIHQELPPTLHCQNPNPRFNFDDSPLYLVQTLKKWAPEPSVLRAGISAFGLGGNNAHIIISNEGVPDTHKATVEPKGGPVVFHRQRYWPGSNGGFGPVNPTQREPVFEEQPYLPEEDEEFLEFFKVSKELEIGSRKI